MKSNLQTLRTRDAAALLEGLRKLDGCKFEGDSAKLRYAIARNIRKLTEVMDDLNAAKRKCMEELSGGTGVLSGTDPKAWEFSKQSLTLEATEVQVELWRISFPTLKVDSNNIDGTTLAAIDPILQDPPALESACDTK